MTAWAANALDRVATADELLLSTDRRDGSRRRAVTIWVVRDGDDAYVRAWRGESGRWFGHARASGTGHISAGGVEVDVDLVAADDAVYDAVDAAYRTKYGRYGDTFVEPMVSEQARVTTLRLVAHEDR